jgi:hypothetical protein
MLGGSHGAAGAVRAGAGGRKTLLFLELVQVHLLLPALEAAEGHLTPARRNEKNQGQ